MTPVKEVESRNILGTRVHATSLEHATETVVDMAKQERWGYICIANVHVLMEGYDSREFQAGLNRADLVTPDGMPVVWMMRSLGVKNQTRVYGPDLTLRVCSEAAINEIPVGFYGSTTDVVEKLIANLTARFKKLNVVYTYCPPFRELSPKEDEEVFEQIRSSGTKILFVGLGCPKQEKWIAANTSKIPAVLLGVGAAFDFHAGLLRQAPPVIQRAGLEWLFRLAMEPRRLWRRYARHNPRFALLALKQLAESRAARTR